VPPDTGRWHWDADDYAKHSGAQRAWAMELVAKLGLAGTEAVLDIGCGDGAVTAELAARVPAGEVVGIDSSEDMIRRARLSFPPDRHPNLSFQLMDARSLGFEDRFEVVFSNATLHWVRDQAAVLRGTAAALKKGGRLLFQMGGRGNAADILAVLEEMIPAEPWSRFFDGFEFPYSFSSPEEYREWIGAAGLSARRIELIPKHMRQDGREALAGWVRTTWLPWTERVPPSMREAFLAEIVDRYASSHPADARGCLTVRMVRLEVEAEKP